MNAAVMTACGEAEVMQYRRVPRPAIAQPGQVLVRLKAAGVNPVDTKIRRAICRSRACLAFWAVTARALLRP